MTMTMMISAGASRAHGQNGAQGNDPEILIQSHYHVVRHFEVKAICSEKRAKHRVERSMLRDLVSTERERNSPRMFVVHRSIAH